MRRRLNDLSEANRKISEYENRIALLSQEIERLNMNLRNKVDENKTLSQEVEGSRRRGGEYEVTIQEWQTKYTRITQDNEELRRRLTDLGEVNRKVSEYENRMMMLSQELERVNSNLKMKVDENSSLEMRLRTLTQ